MAALAQFINRPDPDGDRYPIHWAAARGHARCAELLVLSGADLRVTDAHGRTASTTALANRQHTTYALLLAAEKGELTPSLSPNGVRG